MAKEIKPLQKIVKAVETGAGAVLVMTGVGLVQTGEHLVGAILILVGFGVLYFEKGQ